MPGASRCLSLAALLALAGCAPRVPSGAPPRSGQTALLLSPSSLGEELSLVQRLSVRWGGVTRELEAVVEADAAALTIAFLVLGQRVATVSWTGQVLAADAVDTLPGFLSPPQVVSDFQLARWPVEALRAALPDGLTLELSDGRRMLREGGAPLVEVEVVDAGTMRITNHRLGYVLEVASVDR